MVVIKARLENLMIMIVARLENRINLYYQRLGISRWGKPMLFAQGEWAAEGKRKEYYKCSKIIIVRSGKGAGSKIVC